MANRRHQNAVGHDEIIPYVKKMLFLAILAWDSVFFVLIRLQMTKLKICYL